MSARIPYIRLPESWEAYLDTLPGRRRYQIRKLHRKLNESYEARFFIWEDRDRLDEGIDRLIELHRMRWSGRSDHHAFSSPEYVGFHRKFMHAAHDRGWLRLYCLEADGEIIAMYYFLSFAGASLYFQGGFHPGFEQYAPGRILMSHAIQHAIESGCKRFDMLKGDYRHKRQWTDDVRETGKLVGFRPGIASLAFRARREQWPRLKTLLKPVLGRLGYPVQPEEA